MGIKACSFRSIQFYDEMRFIVVLLVLLVGQVLSEVARFDGYQVYRLRPSSAKQVTALRAIQSKFTDEGIYFWTDVQHVNRSVDIMVSPNKLSSFEDMVKALGLRSELHIKDVQRLIDNEQPKIKSEAASFSWDQYYELDKIHAWLRSLRTQYPNTVTVVEAGKSSEGRDILGVKVSYKSGNKAIFIEGGIHAREWISPATVTYMLNQLLTSTDSSVRKVAENFDWYIFPNTNPDGYVYSHTTNRMWRKSRRYISSYEGEECYGVDLNRNWGFHWNEDDDGSTSPCSELYPGPSGFSEVETKSISGFLSNLTDVKIYISFHSFGQKLMTPYGITGVEPSNEAAMLSIAKAAAASLAKRYGTTYEVGSIIDIEYEAPGSSVDWARGSADVQFAFAYELRDNGVYGFILPAGQIIPTGQETLDSVVTIATKVSESL